MTKLWLVRRTDRIGYDEYDSMVVAADTEQDALYTHPYDILKANLIGGVFYNWVWASSGDAYYDSSWHPKNLTVEYLGTTDRDIKGVVLASFNAG